MRSTFPDINWRQQETIAEGDVVARFEVRDMHQGAFMGVPASGKSICMTALNVYRFEDG
jgi:predicted ester cyclase